MKKQVNNRNSITVVIPAKDECESIATIIKKCIKYADEIIVVDGHSSDSTPEIAESLNVKVIKDNRKGKGDAIRCAVPHINSDIVVFIDADLSHDPRDIPKLVKPILENQADHITASRLIGGSSELHGGFDEFLRLTGSSFITFVINHHFKVRLSDSQNGFRAIKTDVLKKLDLKENITTIEQEMIIKTLLKGYQMAEIPSHEHRRKYGESKISLRKVWFRYVYTLFKYTYFTKR